MDLKRSNLKQIQKVPVDFSLMREIKSISIVEALSSLVKENRFKGETGPQGIPGESIIGPKGLDGRDGESIVGPQGIQGNTGDRGADGARGSIWFSGKGVPFEITDSKDNDFYLDEESSDIYKKINGSWIFSLNIKGKDGRDGKDGVGKIGPRGLPGKDGKDGKSIEGPQGKKGLDGFTPKHEWSGTKLRFQNADGSWGEWTELRGVNAKFVRGASQTIINNGGGSEVFTKSVAPSGTVNLDQFVTSEIRQVEYFVNIYDPTDSKFKGLKLFLIKTDLNPRTQIYARTGDEIPVLVDASFSGLNTEVFLTNNSTNTLEIKYSRIVI